LQPSYWAASNGRTKYVAGEVKEWKKNKNVKILLTKKHYTSDKHFEFFWPTTFSVLYKFDVMESKFKEFIFLR
jgi:hypothetical protein